MNYKHEKIRRMEKFIAHEETSKHNLEISRIELFRKLSSESVHCEKFPPRQLLWRFLKL